METKKFILTLIFVFLLISIYSFFPINNIFQQSIALFVFFGIIPILFNKIFLKKKPGDIGIRLGDWKQGIILSIISLIVSGMALMVLIDFFDFLKHYSVPEEIVYSYKNFLYYSFTKVLFIVVIYDFFFRGFFMMTLGRRLGYRVIIGQFLIFLSLVMIIGTSFWSLLPYVIFAPLAGVVVYKSKSLIYSSSFQFIALIILNAYMVSIIK